MIVTLDQIVAGILEQVFDFLLPLWKIINLTILYTVILQWLEHHWNHENMLETGVFQANEY